MINQHQTIKNNIAKYNHSKMLAEFLWPFLPNKKEVKILDVGSGPYSIIGDYLPGIDVDLHLADNQDFSNFWEKHNATPYFHIENEDMENLTYPDNYFDIVVCINALDHTAHPDRAIEEMIRVCKYDGWIWIDCNLNQLDTGHKHQWNVTKYGVLSNYHEEIYLTQYGFTINYINNGGESRYDKIIATLKKGSEVVKNG